MTEHDAFLEQARSDFSAYEMLLRADPPMPECHVLHYLQMATEKLAKALLIRCGHHPGTSHRAFSRVAAELAARRDILLAIGYQHPDKAARSLHAMRSVFESIEALCPSVAGDAAQAAGLRRGQGRNAEYPWWERDAAGQPDWVPPASRTFWEFQTLQRDARALGALVLVRRLLTNFGNIP